MLFLEMIMFKKISSSKLVLAAAIGLASCAQAEDWPMWLRTPDRMAVTAEKNAPVEWDVESGKNIKWKQQIGSQSYGNPVVAKGLVFLGTNNEAKRDPQHQADGGVLMVFRESDGKFLYQWFRPKLAAGRVNDWP